VTRITIAQTRNQGEGSLVGSYDAYVCDECQTCFCTATELKRHQLAHSDIKGFCCGLCGKDFKRTESVKRHFRRCFATSAVHGFTDIL